MVSLILPCRNAGGTLTRALESILQQSFTDWELVLVDDASTDESPALAAVFSQNDPRIRILPGLEQHCGVVATFQRGLAEAQGGLIGRMDADDWAHPEKLDKQIALLQKRPDLDGVSCKINILGNAETRAGPPRAGFLRYRDWLNQVLSPEDIAAERFVECPIVNPTLLARRKLWQDLGGYRNTHGPEDYDFFLRALEAGRRFAKVPEVLFHWHDGPSRLTRSDKRYSALKFQETKADFLSRLPGVPERGVSICGAGPIGKRMASLLRERGVGVHTFYEVNSRKIGGTWQGIPIQTYHNIPPAGGTPVQLAAVGQPGKRTAALQLLREAGYTPGLDAFAVA